MCVATTKVRWFKNMKKNVNQAIEIFLMRNFNFFHIHESSNFRGFNAHTMLPRG